ncbi:Hydroxyacid-oxoacid transhydrogenase, mitochondrial [Saguinus oedipus]|uniref:Hydroxyacid-oxoacid transhydrogenase, mitochondrial n=1 Tax=Saguinus oedipus TaxID=9490 RepID=A0ABQ9UFB0_SAGOE|nr:Hydroxyacid-oxoacid transhydrogenase, mitochondrial [Saguinus oedipus]
MATRMPLKGQLELVCHISGTHQLPLWPHHALESYTALPYHLRSPCPSNPIMRPAYQGSNPISDIWAVHALRIVAKYLKRGSTDKEALELHFVAEQQERIQYYFRFVGDAQDSTAALDYVQADTDHGEPVVKFKYAIEPHGLSVVLTSPAVFTFTAQMFPERHLETAEILGNKKPVSSSPPTVSALCLLGADTRSARIQDAGPVLADTLRKFLFDLDVDDGLAAVGYSKADIPALVKGTLPQVRDQHAPHSLPRSPAPPERHAPLVAG